MTFQLIDGRLIPIPEKRKPKRKTTPKKGGGFNSFLMAVILVAAILFVFYIWNKRSTEQEAIRQAETMPNSLTGRCNTPGGDCPEMLTQ